MSNLFRRLAVGLALSTTLSFAACATNDDTERVPDRRACERYRDHVVDLRLEGTTADREAHRVALAGSLGDDFLERCITTMGIVELDCVAKAATLEAARACSTEH